MCDSATMTLITNICDEWVGKKKIFTAYEVSRELRNRWTIGGHCPRYGDIRDDIHKILNNCIDYSRQLMNVGATEEAFVYHPNGSDPSQYQPIDRADLNSSNPNRVNLPSQQKTDDDGLMTVKVDIDDDGCVAIDDDSSTNVTKLFQKVVTDLGMSIKSTPISQPQFGPTGANQLAAAVASIKSKTNDDGTVLVGSENRLLLSKSVLSSIGAKPSDTLYIIPDIHKVFVTIKTPSCFDFSTLTVDEHCEVRLRQEAFKKAGIPGTKYKIDVDVNEQRLVIT